MAKILIPIMVNVNIIIRPKDKTMSSFLILYIESSLNLY